ncbi:AMP-binding protein [Ruegeria sp. Alg231-54]|uniref:AMP-binding protein n=1 Tax=Ruegeria sp. Alg231-54 TaxID=1922221 RepID=UPI000D55C542|nr:AMP-binding protein [Ruegeria sp. Alg231-54]
MAELGAFQIRSESDVRNCEAEMSLNERLPETSILDVFVNSAALTPVATAITMLMTGAPDEQPRRVSYEQLLRLIRQAANLFAEIGGPAPGVAYMLPNLVETHATLWGAETAGYAVPINFLLQPDSVTELLKAADVKILVALGPHPQLDIWEKALAARAEIPELKLVRVAAPGTPAEEYVIDLVEALSVQPDDRLTFGPPRQGDDVAAYFHTGGTTGTPKLVAHTHRSQLVAGLGGAIMLGYQPDDVMTATFPLFHVAGTIASGICVFMAGAEQVIVTPSGMRNPVVIEGFWRLVADQKVTLVGGVPTAIGAVLQNPVGDHDISAVRAGITGASLLPPSVSRRFKEVTGATLHEVLGMTEASGLISIDPINGPGNAGSVGWSLPYTTTEVRKLGSDGSLGAVCDVGEIGVIAIEGEHVSPGYRNPANNDGVYSNGVLNSGDLGYKDAKGCLYVAGRSKDLIIRSGHNIDPVMIENAITTHPAVALAAAVGMPDAYAGELPICYVQLQQGADADLDDLKAHAEATIDERPAWPRVIEIINEIPLTSVGKIFKPSLRCNAAKMVVSKLLREEFDLPDADVSVFAGGTRGLRVDVKIPENSRSVAASVESALEAYLFESRISVQ